MELGFQIEPNAAAAAMVRGKAAVVQAAFDKMLPDVRARAFTISGVASLGVIERVRDEIATLPEGGDWNEIKGKVADLLEPHLGEEATTRAELLLRTHGYQVYQAGVWQRTMADEDLTHFEYVTAEDMRVRPSHAALNGLVIPKGDPFWKSHFPPWEWGCRCRVIPMSERMVEDVRQEVPAAPAPEPEAAPEPVVQKPATAPVPSMPPEEQRVIEGPRLERLRGGQVERALPADPTMPIDPVNNPPGMPRTFDVTPSSEKMGGGSGFSWNPDTLTVPLRLLERRFEPADWAMFKGWAERRVLGGGLTLWEWLARYGADPDQGKGQGQPGA